MSEPSWITIARKYIGTKEIPGEKNNPLILRWWKLIKRAGIKNDETPWCAAFVGGVLEEAGIVSSRYESAASYLKWGEQLPGPAPGCIVVFHRPGGGHVGFVVGRDPKNRLMVLGGNQGDKVSIAPFDTSRVVGYRWPKAVTLTETKLPCIGSTERSSTNEA